MCLPEILEQCGFGDMKGPPFEPEPPARPPEVGFYDLVIGEFANRTDTVPATFRREALDIRHRLPDRRVDGAIAAAPNRSVRGCKAPERCVFAPGVTLTMVGLKIKN